MAEEDDSKRPPSWWQTMPGVMTGIAALITALTGLLVAAHQTGLIGGSASAPARTEKAASETTSQAPSGRSAMTAAGTPPMSAVEFAVPQTISVGKDSEAKFTFMQATVEPRNAESVTLRLLARMSNPGRYSANFWDRSFRLRTHNAIVPASGGLNELVEGGADSSLQTLSFVVERSSVPSALLIEFGGETTELPLRFSGSQR
jgi:hypothetical protein